MSRDAILDDSPGLEWADIDQCILYAAMLAMNAW